MAVEDMKEYSEGGETFVSNFFGGNNFILFIYLLNIKLCMSLLSLTAHKNGKEVESNHGK